MYVGNRTKIANFPTPRVFNAPAEGVPLGILYRRTGLKKLEWCGFQTVEKVFSDRFSRFDTIPECDRHPATQPRCRSYMLSRRAQKSAQRDANTARCLCRRGPSSIFVPKVIRGQKFRNWVTWPRPRLFRGRFIFSTQEGSVLYLCAEFEADCSIRSKVIKGSRN